MRISRLLFAGVLGLAVLTRPPSLDAQPVLHEPVAAPSLRCDNGICRRDSEPKSALPEAVVSDEGLLGAPLGSRNPKEHEPIFASANTKSPLGSELMRGAPPPGHDPPPVRRSRVPPDAATGTEPAGERVYHEVFNPAVFPYKRMTVLDAVDDTGALYISDPLRHERQLQGNHLIAGRDPFYGSLVVDFVAGEPVALPTPAAGVRLLSYQTTPELPLYFYTDGNDNLYALAARSGRHRLVFLVDAEQRYFAGPLTAPGRSLQGLRDEQLPRLPGLPHGLRHDVNLVLRHIGIRSGAASVDYADTLSRLVGYFRNFAIAELPDDSGASRQSLYLRIALSQRGVCRHRGYAFVITAQAAGIPARYVENELHVFVEVYIPDPGPGGGYWRRINLGGAPLQQRIFGGENRVAYQEKGGDPFTRPPSFSQGPPPEVTGAPPRKGRRRDGSPERADSLPALDGPEDRASRRASDSATGKGSDRSEATGRPSAPADPTATNGSGKGGSGTGGTGGTGGTDRTGGTGPATRSSPSGSSSAGEPALGDDQTEAPDDSRSGSSAAALLPTQVRVSLGSARQIYRGTAVSLRGQVDAAGPSVGGRASLGNLEVLLLLAVPKRTLILGRTVTRSDGSFETEVEVPATAPLGHFGVIARVRGDSTRRGSSSSTYDRLPPGPAAARDFVGNE